MTEETILRVERSLGNLSQVMYDLTGFRFVLRSERRVGKKGEEARLSIYSEPITDKEVLGIAAFMFKELRIQSFGTVWEDSKTGDITFQFHFSYEHHDGGSNGCSGGIGGRPVYFVLHKDAPTWAIVLR